jgi:hypothetical protein
LRNWFLIERFFEILYRTAGDEQEIVYNTAKSLDNLVSGAQTVLLVDGFLSNSTSPMSQSTKNC